MKNIKQHNLLFAAACFIFAQFTASIIFAYLQVIGGLVRITEITFYFYIIYCVTICASCLIFIIRKPEFTYVKLWFSGLFIYIFCEILFFVKLFVTAYKDIPGFSLFEPNYERTITTYNLHDGQPFFRLFICFAVISAIYIFIYISEKNRAYLNLTAINLIIISLIIILVPVSYYLESDYAIDILAYSAARESALIIIFVNLIAHAIYLWYKQD